MNVPPMLPAAGAWRMSQRSGTGDRVAEVAEWSGMSVLTLPTPHGPARAHLRPAAGGTPRAALALGHGAGGSVTAPDLTAVTAAAARAGLTVALVEQPYRVAGRRSTPATHLLDEAWIAVMEQLRAGPLAGLPLACGGRSSGARVACRTATTVGAAAVVCLAFPLQPSRPRKDGSLPPSRLPELDGAGVPVLVVQGLTDRFGMVEDGPGRTVVRVEGDHGLKRDVAGIGATVAGWLTERLAA
jgi:predicted alpha/beta-hydrolase family hydrolase